MRHKRERGHPTEQLGFRCPIELLEAVKAEDPDKTAGAIALLDIVADAKEAMGDDWVEVLVYAHRNNVYPGEALARLAKLGLKAKK